MEPEHWSDWSDSVITSLTEELPMTAKADILDTDSHTVMVQFEEEYATLYHSFMYETSNTNEQYDSSSDELNVPLAKLHTTKKSDIFDTDSHTAMVYFEEEYATSYHSFMYETSNTNEQYDSSSDELNVPLAKLKQRLWDRNQASNILIAQKLANVSETYQENQPIDSLSEDPCSMSESSYKPSQSETYSEPDDIDVPKPIQKRKRMGRNTNWKKRGKHIKRRKTQMKKRPQKSSGEDSLDDSSSENEEISQTKRMSLKESRLQKMLQNIHEKRIDKLLSSNLLERTPVPADGNCLFAAVLQFLNHPIAVRELREMVAEHLEGNMKSYIDFVKFPEDCTDPDKQKEFYLKFVHQLKLNGQWDTEMSDLVPLCIANVFQRDLRIFSSRQMQPVLDIKPHISQVLESSPILIAHLAMKGCEHYDSVAKKCLHRAKETENVMTDRGAHANQDLHQDDIHGTPQTPAKSSHSTEPLNMTPHKDAFYKSPTKKKLTRRKIAKKHLWKSNVRKEARSKGLSYTSKKGRSVKARDVKPIDCTKCKFKCTEKVSSEQRENIFKTYWSLSDYSAQRHFICHHVEDKEPARRLTHSQKRRTSSLSYHFTYDINKVRVCKAFFLATLDVGRKTVETAIKNKQNGTFAGRDNRGRHTPANKTPDTDLIFVRDHISSFPTVDPHYTRKDTKRKYLSQELNIRSMYCCYTEQCKKANKKAVSEKVYRNIFCTEFNLSFFHPKKDQCQQCTVYDMKKANGELDDDLENSYVQHQERKKRAREEKAKDKCRAKSDPTFYAATFDLEAVLTTPCSLVGELYYKRKLSCYNLSFYSLGNGVGTCYLWDETHGNRGSCEVGTCLISHLNSLSNKTSSIKEITLYSDTCGGQNRNQYVAAALLFCIQQNQLSCINQKFFERGHSNMECDTIHSTVEHAKKRTSVYVPSQWETVISLARKVKPYIVVPMKFGDILDLKKLKEKEFRNMKVSKHGERINWLKIKWLQVRKDCPNSLFVNYTFDADEFIEVVARTRKRGKCGTGLHLSKRYDSKLAISAAKKADLLSLCVSGTIPEEYRAYYESLPDSKAIRDKLPAPAASEQEEDTSDN